RDGFELSEVGSMLEKRGMKPTQTRSVLHRSIFALDVYHLLNWAEAAVININGRVPDEGTVVEAALAWHAAKAVVIYKKDDRAPFTGEDNPMLTCLSDLRVTAEIGELPAAVERELQRDRSGSVKHVLTLGKEIAQATRELTGTQELSRHLADCVSAD
ncbi:MAG: hypothetical protein VX733_09690, partial [Candidatus Latescibacterota bacterium]|nr:hypothetical protein [Candidatus Latescibacterota bacterium]